jgi:uncharacterized alpha-E superfamily protein
VKYHILLPSTKEVGTPLDFLHWMALLKSVTAFNTYRRLYGNIDSAGIVEFLVLNKLFPRSIYYCLKEAENCLLHISGNFGGGYQNPVEKAIGLHEYLDSLQLRINHISNLIDSNFFTIKDNFVTQTQNQE